MKTSKCVSKSPPEIDTFAHKIQKIALPMRISVFINPSLQLPQILKPIRLLFCNDSFYILIHLYLKYIPYYYQEISRTKKLDTTRHPPSTTQKNSEYNCSWVFHTIPHPGIVEGQRQERGG